MAQFLYFLPGLREAAINSIPLRNSVLRERGLADIFSDVVFDEWVVNELTGRGPGDKSGCILCAQDHKGNVPRRAGYYPDEQQWQPIGDGSLLWIGFDPSEPPKPEELQRKSVRPGYSPTLSDEREWLIPVIRRKDGSTLLPTHFAWDMTGKMVEPVKPAYLKLWDEWAGVVDALANDKWETFSDEQAIELAMKAMAINYRFGRNEQSIIGALSRDNVGVVLAATVDAPSWHGG